MVTLFCLFAAYRLHMAGKETFGWFIAAFIAGTWADVSMIKAVGEAF